MTEFTIKNILIRKASEAGLN